MLVVIAVVVVVVAVLCALFVLALGRASRQLKSSDQEAFVLATLAKERSPSGRAFFPTEESALELVEALQADSDERRSAAKSRRTPRGR